MTIRIKETGETKELGIIDPVSGMNWISDFIGNTGAMNDGQFTWNEKDDLYEVSEEDLDWWENLVEEYEKADKAQYKFKKTLDTEDREAFENEIFKACNCDLEDMPRAILSEIEEWGNR